MGFEEQLRQAYQRAGQPEPDEAGAYDRFLRHRARQRRRVRVAIGVGLALLLGLVVLTPRLLAGSQGAAGGAERLLSRPMQGFELRVPKGWEVAHDYGDLIDLLPRRWQGLHGGAQIDLQVTFVAPEQYPGGPPPGVPRTGAGLRPDERMDGYDLSGGPYTTGQRADGRPWVRVELPTIDGRHHVDYAIAWPYRCAPGGPCPRHLKLRVLLLQVYGYDRDWPTVDAAARQMVQTARPITNAVQAPATGRPVCDLADPAGWLEDARRIADGSVRVRMELIGGAVPCHAHGKLAVAVKVGTTLARVQGAGAAVTLDGDLPERVGRLSATWTWKNWCGAKDVTLWRVDPDQPGREQQLPVPLQPEMLPRCIDRHRPSTLEAVRTTR
jgi:hypothetical protein